MEKTESYMVKVLIPCVGGTHVVNYLSGKGEYTPYITSATLYPSEELARGAVKYARPTISGTGGMPVPGYVFYLIPVQCTVMYELEKEIKL